MTSPCDCALWIRGAGCEASPEEDGELKKWEGWHGLLIISPQSPGFHKKEEIPNFFSAGVTGTGPVKLLLDTLKTFKADWFSGGIEPLNRFESSLR